MFVDEGLVNRTIAIVVETVAKLLRRVVSGTRPFVAVGARRASPHSTAGSACAFGARGIGRYRWKHRRVDTRVLSVDEAVAIVVDPVADLECGFLGGAR